MKQKKKRLLLISRLIGILFILISVFFSLIVWESKVLPTKYLLLFVGGFGSIILLFSWFLIGKKFRSWVKIFSIVVSFLIMAVLGFGLYYIERTYNFMNNIKERFSNCCF